MIDRFDNVVKRKTDMAYFSGVFVPDIELEKGILDEKLTLEQTDTSLVFVFKIHR